MRIGCSGSEGLQGFGGGTEFGDAGEDGFDGVAMIFGAAIGHGVGDEDDVVAVVVGAARGGFDADGGGDSGDENLSDIATAEIIVEVRAGEGAGALFGDEMVGRFYIEFGDEIGPVGWKGHFRTDGVGAAGGGRSYVDEHDGQVSKAECTGELGGVVDDFLHGVSAGNCDDSFLQVDDD